MIRINNHSAKVMEFTRFRKKKDVSDDELLLAVLKFETTLSLQQGLVFHCLVRNYDNEYANVLFSESIQCLKDLENHIGDLPEVKNFFSLIEPKSVQVEYHEIQKESFQVPAVFSCVERGIFSIRVDHHVYDLLQISQNIEEQYLNMFDNTQAHFIGRINANTFSEITLVKTLGATKKTCMGYLDDPSCQELLAIADQDSMELDFWYLIA